MSDAVFLHRLQFAFTIVYHYLFPQLTMGLALLIVVLKALGLRPGGERWNDAARFWIRIFGINFAVGVVTGIPMEFQFGTNWARVLALRRRRHRPDARDGGAVRVLPRVELPRPARLRRAAARPRAATSLAAVRAVRRELAVRLLHRRDQRVHAAPGRPRGRRRRARCSLADFGAFLLNPWALAQYAHNMVAAVVTASFVVAAVGAFYALRGTPRRARRGASCALGVVAGLVAERARGVPDRRPPGEARRAASAGGARRDGGPVRERADAPARPHRPAERRGAAARQPDRRCRACSRFLAYGTFHAHGRGPRRVPGATTWPDNIELLYYSFHIMAGLGHDVDRDRWRVAALLAAGAGALERSRPMLWVLMLAFPLPVHRERPPAG